MSVVRSRPCRSLGTRSLVVLSGTAGLLALVGLVAPRSLEVDRLEQENLALERRLALLPETATGTNDTELAERVRRGESLLDGLFPAETDALESYGLVRFAAESNGLSLSDVRIGEALPAERATRELPLGLREVQLRGEGELDDLVAALEDLASLGAPHQVLDFELDAASREDGGLAFALTLGLQQQLDGLPATGAEAQP